MNEKTSEDLRRVEVTTHSGPGQTTREDTVVVEEPLELRLSACDASGRRTTRSVYVTMRTPGQDFDLTFGFLLAERVIRDPSEVTDIDYVGAPPAGAAHSNVVRVELASGVRLDDAGLARNFLATSSCGLCGKSSLEGLETSDLESLGGLGPEIAANVIPRMPAALRSAQRLFDVTGGLHAAGLVTSRGTLELCREDIGRHNAVDKLVGAKLRLSAGPLHDYALVLSGRVSFEVLQKSLAAGIPFVVAVGAPSSLAIDLATRFGMTLVAFLRGERFNVYAGGERIVGD